MITSRRRRSVLREEVSSLPRDTKARRIDRDAGILYGVKILGVTSSNDGGRRYLPEAIRKAAKLYENASVRIDHPDEPESQRSSHDVLGWLRSVRVGKDGCLYGDLHYLKTHPFAPRLVEAAERNPRAFGLSHNASGETERKNGTLLVYEITEVHSVDLVADPATTTGLFESKSKNSSMRRKPMKLQEWFDRSKLLPINRKTIKRLFEGGYMDPEQEIHEDEMPPTDSEPATSDPVVQDPADMDPEVALKTGFNAAMHAVIDDTTLDIKAKLSRLKELMQAADRLLASGEEIPEGEDMDFGDDEQLEEGHDEDEEINKVEDDSITESEGEDMPCKVKESKHRKLSPREEYQQLKREKEVRILCESEGYSPTPALMTALCALKSKEDRLALINETRRSSYKARTTRVTESKTIIPDVNVETTEDFLAFISGEAKN